MSFYDDASLVFLPSGGAGKDGKAYSIKPVPEYGTNLVTNGGFNTDSDWIKGTGWTISGGTANCDGTQSSTSQLRTSVGLSIQNTLVRFSFEVKNYSAGTLIATIEGTGGNEFSGINSNGIYTVEATSTDSTPRIAFNADSSFIGSIDNVSVREVVVGDGDFTFSRGSNLTATRVDSNGLIEKGRENLLTQSNSFDNAIWIGRSQTTLIEGQGGYDGSNDAWSCATTTGQIMGQSKVNQGVQTISVYAKGSVSNGLRIFAFGNDNVDFWFNLNTGLPDGSISSKVIDYNIEDVNGDGEWYRCSFTFSQTTSSIYFYCTDNNKSNASGTIYLQDAQLEQGLVATEYIESGATTGLAGILEDSPRFDYSGGASCPSLLLEPSRTNIVPISEGIPEDTNAVTLTENYGTSPEGVQNSLKVQKDGVSSNDRILPIDNYNATLVSGTSYSVSAFVKNIDVVNSGVTTIGCRLGIGGTLFRLGYEWNGSSLAISTTYAAGTRTNEILEDYGNGWWRIGFSFEADNTQGNIELDIDRDNGSDTTSIETYGWQLEEGSYPTSYIPNHSGGSVTREVDYSESSTSLSIGDSEFCAYYEMDAKAIPREGSATFFRIEFGSNSHFIGLKGSSDSINNMYTLQTLGNYSETLANITESEGVVKFLINYSSGTGDLFINGTTYAGVITGPATGNIIDNIELRGSGYSHDSKQILLFPEALSTADCEILTGVTAYESFSAMATALNYTTYE